MRVISERQLATALGTLGGYIVSEQGTATVWGHDASGQAEQIIGHVAHPSVRQQLREAGRLLSLRL